MASVPDAPEPWRDHLSRRLAGVLAIVAVGVSAVTAFEVDRLRPLVALFAVVASGTLARIAFDGRPREPARSWIIVGFALVGVGLGYLLLGFLGGPTAGLGATLLLSGLLLGRRALWIVVAVSAGMVAAIGLGMVAGWIPVPPADAVSFTSGRVWARTMFVAFSFLALSTVAIVDLVDELERAVERARSETRRRAEAEREKLVAQREKLEAQKMETIGRLAAGIGHDLNNALVAVIGSAEILLEELEEEHPSRKLADDIRKAGQQATGIIRQLLAYSQRVGLHVAPIDVPDIVHAAVALFDRIPGIHPSVVVDLAAEHGKVLGDSALLQSALLNLLLNARDATSATGTVQVRTRTAHLPATAQLPAGPYLELEVADSGSGIDPVYLDRIFEPFFTTKGRGKGTGLGLASVAGTARAHLGDVTVRTGATGSTFCLHLPLVPEAAASGRVVWCGEDQALRQLGPAALRLAGFDVALGKPEEIGANDSDWYVANANTPAPAGSAPRMVRFDGRTMHLAALVREIGHVSRASQAVTVVP